MKLRLILIFTFFGNLLFSQNISTDRPSNTDNSSTLKKGFLQFETGVSKSSLYKENPREISFTIPTFQLRYGLGKNIELRILEEYGLTKFIPESFGTTEQNYGLNSIHVGTKIQILKKESSPIEFALLTQFLIPKFSNQIPELKNTTKLIGSYSLKRGLSFGFTFGYTNNYAINDNGVIAYSLLINKAIGSKTSFFLECYGLKEEINKTFINTDAGIAYLIKENIQVDFYFGTGINNSMIFGSLGFSWYLKRTNE